LTGQIIACGVLTRDNLRSSDQAERQHKRFYRTGEIRGEIFEKKNERRIIKGQDHKAPRLIKDR
jgi:hypothetical protein